MPAWRWSTIIRSVLVLVIVWGNCKVGFAEVQWQASNGYAFTPDAQGFTAPTGIAFLHKPGGGGDAPLYVVAELRGDIKTVRNSRRVSLFAKSREMFVPDKELPELSGEIGQIGTCLDHNDEHLFTTSVTVKGNTRINRMQRWRSTGVVHWQSGELDQELTSLFEKVPTNNPHQIGFCFVGSDDKLWVGTGDGAHHRTAHLIDFPNGKLLRLNLDFSAPVDNPYFSSQRPNAVENYVYASGFRNPFSIAEVAPKQIFLADNGPNIDRLLMIVPGQDYPWDGTSNESMIYGNALTWPKAIGPSGMIYIKSGTEGLEGLWGHLVIAGSYEGVIYALPVDPKVGVMGPPRRLVERVAGNGGALTGLALGPDGIYAAYIDIKRDGGFNTSSVYKLTADATQHPERPASGERSFDDLGCRGCHMLAGHGSPMAPPLDNLIDRLRDRIKDPTTAKIKTWIETKIQKPQFEDPHASMPDLNVSAVQAGLLADFLIEKGDLKNRPPVAEESFFQRAKWLFNQNLKFLLPVVFLLGLAIGYMVTRNLIS